MKKYSEDCWVSCPKCEIQLQGLPKEDEKFNEIDELDESWIPSHYCLGLIEIDGFPLKEKK